MIRAQFKQKNKNLLCNATGGPCKVISRPAKEAHHGLGITAGDFEVVAGHLKDVLKKDKVGPKEQEEVFAISLGSNFILVQHIFKVPGHDFKITSRDAETM